MSLYIWIALLSYFCFALTGIGDKFILSKSIKHPLAYAFYIGLFSPIVFILAPFGFHVISPGQIVLAFLGGMSFIYALVFLYRAINQSGASRAVTMIGGLQPIFVLTLAFFLAGERLSGLQMGAFALMLMGSVLVSVEKIKGKWSGNAILDAVVAAFLFALAFALYKTVYNQTNFISGLIWTRFGLTVGSLSFLLYKPWRQIIFGDASTKKPNSHKLAFLSNFTIGATGSFLQNFAISLGSVSIVTALSGIQFAFLLGLVYLLTKYFPKVLTEDLSKQVLMQKIIAIALIGSGLVILNI